MNLVLNDVAGARRVPLADLGRWIGGGTPSKSRPEYWSGSIPWVSPKDMKVARIRDAEDHISEAAVRESSTTVVPAGSVLMVTRSGILSRTFPVAVTDAPVALNQDLKALTPRSDVDPSYVYWTLRSLEREILDNCSKDGTTVASIDTSRLMRVEILLPQLGEQRRIVSTIEELLSRLDAGSAEIAAAERKLTTYEQALLHTATLGRLQMQDRPRQPSSETASDSSLPQLPVRWRWARLESIADVVGGVAKDAKKQVGSDLVEVPYLRVANVQRGRLDLREISTIRVPPGVLKKLALRYGDVLMNEGGDRDKLGRGWIWEDQIPNCIHQNHVFRVRIRDSALEPRLLSWHGNSFGQAWFQREGKQTTNLASISLNRLKRLPVPVPPAEEQHAIVGEVDRCLSVTKVIRDELERARSSAKQLQRAILAAAFTGRLPIEPGLGQAWQVNRAPELSWATQ